MKKLFLYSSLLLVAACGSNESNDSSTEKKATAPIYDHGKELFVQNCIQCHRPNRDAIGPALKGVMAKWDNDTANLRAFVRNSGKVIESGHPRAVKVYEEWNKVLMTPLPHLTNEDIDEILEYVERAE